MYSSMFFFSDKMFKVLLLVMLIVASPYVTLGDEPDGSRDLMCLKKLTLIQRVICAKFVQNDSKFLNQGILL